MTAYDTEEGLTLEAKRAAVRRKVTTEAMAIYTWSDDIEPKLLCEIPISGLLPNMEVIEIIYPAQDAT